MNQDLTSLSEPTAATVIMPMPAFLKRPKPRPRSATRQPLRIPDENTEVKPAYTDFIFLSSTFASMSTSRYRACSATFSSTENSSAMIALVKPQSVVT